MKNHKHRQIVFDLLSYEIIIPNSTLDIRGGSRTAATSKMEHLVIIVNGWKPLTIVTKSSILDVKEVLDPTLDIKRLSSDRDSVIKLYLNFNLAHLNYI